LTELCAFWGLNRIFTIDFGDKRVNFRALGCLTNQLRDM